jgi:hypothetical protein
MADEGAGRFLFRAVVGAPNSYPRWLLNLGVSFFTWCPMLFLVADLRKHQLVAYTVVIATYLAVYSVTSRLVNRFADRLNERYRVY